MVAYGVSYDHEGLVKSTHKTHTNNGMIYRLMDCDLAMITYNIRIGNVHETKKTG